MGKLPQIARKCIYTGMRPLLPVSTHEGAFRRHFSSVLELILAATRPIASGP